MLPDFGLAGGRARRLLAFVLTMSIAVTLCLGATALRPSSAQAWAWKDNCALIVFNKTGDQSSVRPILYTPLLPNPASLAEYAAFAITGLPTTSAAAFVNSGYPVPSYGCHAFMNFSNPGPTVSCKVSAPTTGANTFSCEGAATTQIIKDDDDIGGNVFIPQGSAGAGPAPSRQPKTGPAAVRTDALPGRGWRRSDKITSFGLVGDLMNYDALPASCANRGRAATAKAVSSEELVRRGGSQDVGAVVSTYGDSSQSRHNVADALSSHSIGCLARLLTSARLHTSVQTGALATGAPASNVSGTRLVIRRHGGVRATDYLDVLGEVKGRRDAIEMLQSAGRPMASRLEASALRALRMEA